MRLGPQGCANTGQLYFGKGSKLTVLGKEGSWGSTALRGAGWSGGAVSYPAPLGLCSEAGRHWVGDAGCWVLSELWSARCGWSGDLAEPGAAGEGSAGFLSRTWVL